jgi:hypothetical protein
MDPYLLCLISTYVPKHVEILTELAGGKLIREEKDGNTYANGVLHSFDDKPAEIWLNNKYWYKLGKLHRDNDLPAIIHSDGSSEWFQNGLLHREQDLSARITKEFQVWYKNGLRHRDNDLPASISAGIQEWWKNGQLHRDNDKPAIIYKSGFTFWYKNGKQYYPKIEK